jgi:prepilin-type processing-associated H-X9-DG protein
MAEIVPFLGEGTAAAEDYQALARRIQRRKAWDDPANAPAVNTVVRPFLCPGHPDFRPNTPPGVSHYTGLAGVGADSPSLSREDPRAGVFGTDRGVKRSEAVAGISFTLVAVETAYENGPWLCGLPATVRGVPRRDDDLFGEDRPFGGIHRGGLNGLWLDGSARWMSDATPPNLFREQVTLTGREE